MSTAANGDLAQDEPAVPAKPDYELLMVTYHSRHHVENFLAAMTDAVPFAIVDNAQGADGLEEFLKDRPDSRYQHGQAQGFASAANAAATTSNADYLVFVNPDSRPSLATIEALVATARSNPRLGAVAAMPVGPDGRTEHGVGGWQPTFRRALVHAVGAHKIFKRSGLFARPGVGENCAVDWVTGTVMVVPRRIFNEVGQFDESFFVYSEDVDFGAKLRAAGYEVRLRSDLPVSHSAGSSGGSSLGMQRLKGAAFAAYAKRRIGKSRGAAVIVVMTAGFLSRALVSRLTGRKGLAQTHEAYIRGMLFGTGPLPGVAKTE